MVKIAVVIVADTETHGDLGRAVNALLMVREAKEAGDEIRLIFDGAGTKWIGILSDSGHRSHALYKAVEDQITGVCEYCVRAFEATGPFRQRACLSLTSITSIQASGRSSMTAFRSSSFR